ncbi:MAG TPA: amidohydrolase family protein [Acidimicrobiia bacterium]
MGPGVVVIDGRHISYAGTESNAPKAADAETVEVPVVLPGLWDCHAHLFGAPFWDLERTAWVTPAAAAARATADLARYLLGGVTSIREVGGLGVELAPVVDEGTLVGPTIYGAGEVLSTTGGHGDIHSIPLEIYRHFSAGSRIVGRLADGPDECIKAVREQMRRNARVIKICASGGVMSEVDHPIHQQFSEDEISAMVTEAARAERVVAAHCHGKPGIMAALRSGVRTIEHGSFLDEEAAELMKELGAILVPTRFIVEELLGMESLVPAYAYRKISALADTHAQALKIAVATGVTIAMGTDIFPSGPIHGFRYGQASREVRHLIEAGMTPLQAIEAATANGPLTLGPQAPTSGQIAEGYDADLIAFDANPLDDVSIWGSPDRVTHVWKGGRRVK